MSKLKDLVSKGVRLIVADTEEGIRRRGRRRGARDPRRDLRGRAAPKRVTRSEVPADVEDFGAVYQEAGIELPAARLRHRQGGRDAGEQAPRDPGQREVKATAVLAALEAAERRRSAT